MTAFSDLLSSDPFGPACVAPADLDAAFARADKPAQVPRTCLPADTPRDLGALEDALGHAPNMLEQTQFLVAWDVLNGETPDFSVFSHFPGRETCAAAGSACCHSALHNCLPGPPVVPAPAGGLLLLSALVVLGGLRWFRWPY